MLHPYEIAKCQQTTMVRRSCLTCTAFIPAEGNHVSLCANRVSIDIRSIGSEKISKLTLKPGPDDWYSCHHTQKEDQQKDTVLGLFWQRLVSSKNQVAEINQSA